jgi:prepilin-type N-terminal cleavage/methylation domain-containing protein
MPPPLAARQARRGPARPPAGWWRVGAAGGARGVVHQRATREGDRAWHCRCLGWQAFRGLWRTAGRVTGPVDSQAGRDGNNRSPDRGHAYRRVAAGAQHGNPAAVRGRKLREKHMKTTQHHNKRSGFTLIEMVGVLAVIAILAALLVPKIFAAIQESRINNAVGTLNSVKAATMSYFAKNGGFDATTATGPKFDQVLITAGELETPFKTRIGTGWECRVDAYDDAKTPGETKFAMLDGDSAAASGNVVYCKIEGVNLSDAQELSQRLDGANMSTTSGGDDKGRVIYDAPGDDGKTTVLVYIAHK